MKKASPTPSPAVSGASLTFADLVRLGSLDAVPPMPDAIATLTATRDALVEAEAAQAQQQPEPLTRAGRRAASRSRENVRDRLLDAQTAVEDARRAVTAARRVAFDATAPTIRDEHLHRLPRLEAALREVAAAATDLLDVERVASNFARPSGGSIAPSRSALPGAVAERILAFVEGFSFTIRRLAPATTSAA